MMVLDPHILKALPSYSPQETGRHFVHLLTETKLSPIGQWCGPARLGGLRVGGFSFALMEFGTTMGIEAAVHADHFMMMCCLQGSALVEVDSSILAVSAGEAVLARPSRYMKARFSSDCVRLAIRIDPHLLSPKVYPDPQIFSIDSDDMKPWFETIGFLFSTPSLIGVGARDPVLLKGMEGVLFRILRASPLYQTVTKFRSPAASRDVRKAEIFVHAHASTDISLADIAAAADVNVRTLQLNFMRYRNMTPMEYLRNLRLDRARDLLTSGSVQVADAASDCGFAHQGRFASRYRARFGETPSLTLKRAAPAH
jgi:AraC-like DNA-binding protein